MCRFTTLHPLLKLCYFKWDDNGKFSVINREGIFTAYFEVQSWHLSGRPEENAVKHQSNTGIHSAEALVNMKV
jgi:hypothetical protein